MICGRVRWCGNDPRVIRLTDNETRKVQVQLERVDGKHRFNLEVVLDDPETFIDELAIALAWVQEQQA